MGYALTSWATWLVFRLHLQYTCRCGGIVIYNHVLYCFRSLGVHVSKVRSLILDAWEPEQVKVRLGIGKRLPQQPDRVF